MHALSVSLLRAKQLPVITNGLGASPHAGSTCTIGVVTVRPLNRLPARLYFKLKPDPNNTFFFIFTCTTQYPWVLANLNLSQAMAPSKKKRTHTVFRDSSAHRSASTSKPRFVGERVKLGDVLQVVNGKNQKAVKDENGQYPIYGSGGQMGWASSYICPADTVIIGRKGNINKPIYVSEPFWNVDTAFGLVAKPELLDARYLYHFCKHYDFGKLNTTCTIPSLTRKNIEGILLRLPSLGGQKETAAQLDSILKQIALAQQEIAGLDSLVKSRFVEMLDACDLDTVNRLDSCTKRVKVGFVGTVGKYYTDDSGVPMVRTTNITSMGLDLTDLRFVTEEFDRNNTKSHLRSGDVIIARHGENGRACAYWGPEAQCLNVVMIEPDESKLLPTCLEHLMNSDLAREQIASMLVGSTQKVVNTKTIASILVPAIPLDLQHRFAAFVSQVDKSRFVRDHEMNFR